MKTGFGQDKKAMISLASSWIILKNCLFSLDFRLFRDMVLLPKYKPRRIHTEIHTMTRDEKQAALRSLFRELPEIMTPIQIARAIHQSKNLVYEKLKEKKLPGYIVHGRYLIAKADLIEYIIEHGDEERPGRFRTCSNEQ